MRDLPPRDLGTMADAIAIASPSGRISKRAHGAACARLSEALFGPGGLEAPQTAQPSEREVLLRKARELRELAERGMCVRKYRRIAEDLEQRAADLAEAGR